MMKFVLVLSTPKLTNWSRKLLF